MMEEETPGLDALRELLLGVKQGEAKGSRAVDRLRTRTARRADSRMEPQHRPWRGLEVDSEFENQKKMASSPWPEPLSPLDHHPEIRRPKKKKKKMSVFGKIMPMGNSPSSLDPIGRVQSRAATPEVFSEEVRCEPPLSCSLAVVRDWSRSFHREESSFESVSVFLETRLREALVQTSAAGMAAPNRARAAMVCDLLLKVPRLFGRYAPLVRNLVSEVLRCVYDDFESLEAKVISKRLSKKSEEEDGFLEALDSIDAQTLFGETAYFDMAFAFRKRAAMLQAELKESSEGAGLVKIFRERFLLWDGRNLLLRCILFFGWRKYTRTMVTGRLRLKRMRLQYWYDRFWEGIEREREEKEGLEERVSAALAEDAKQQQQKQQDDTLSPSPVVKKDDDDDDQDRQRFVGARAHVRRSRRESRRESRSGCLGLLQAAEDQFGDGDPSKAADAALKFLGVAEHRAQLLEALDLLAASRLIDVRTVQLNKNTLSVHDVLISLIRVMEDNAAITLNANLAFSILFATGVKLFNDDDDDTDDDDDDQVTKKNKSIDDEVDYVEWLGFGPLLTNGACYAWERIRNVIADLPPYQRRGSRQEVRDAKATQTDPVTFDDDKKDDDDSENGAIRKKKKAPRRKIFPSNNEDHKEAPQGSKVAIATACQLIPLVYDRLLEICDGTEESAAKVKLAEVAKYALVRRFGIKTIANNYYRSLQRTAQTCSEGDRRLELFALVFGIDFSNADSPQESSGRLLKQQQQRGKSSSTVTPPKKDPERQNEVVAIFADLWQNYFTALEAFESTKISSGGAARKRIRASIRLVRPEKGKASASHFGSFLARLSTGEEQVCSQQEKKDAVEKLKSLAEFQSASAADLEKIIEASFIYEAPAGVTLLTQKDASQEAVLILGLEGEASVYVKTSSLLEESSSSNNKGTLVKTMVAPFVCGEGRLLTGMKPTATMIVSSQTAKILVCRLEAFEQLLESGNKALLGLEINVVQRAEERLAATGASVSRERIAVYRQFFTDVDVTRSGKIILPELLEALNVRGTKLQTRDLEKAFQQGNTKELDFEQFIKLCDSLSRRGKRLFDKGNISDVLKTMSDSKGGKKKGPSSNVLYEAFVVSVERTFRHGHVHEPETYKQLIDTLDAIQKRKVSEPSQFLASAAAKVDANNKRQDGPATKPSDQEQTTKEFVVIDADEAFLAAMKFWEIEAKCKYKLVRVTRARIKVGTLVARWLKRKRERKQERQLFEKFLEKDKATLRGVVDYGNFIDLVEDAYGAPIDDDLGALLFAEFEDLAAHMAYQSKEALAYAQRALCAHVAAAKIQLFRLRTKSAAKKNTKTLSSSSKQEDTSAKRRAQVLISICISASLATRTDLLDHDGGVADIVANLHIDVGARITQFLLSIRPPKVNLEAAFLAFQHHGLRMGAGATKT